MSFLKEIASKKKNLRHCKTVITNTMGESYLEDGQTGLVTNITSSQKGPGYIVDLKPDLQMAEIIPGLLLGSQDPTGEVEMLCAHCITHVLSLGVQALSFPEKQLVNVNDAEESVLFVSPSRILYKYVPFLDIPEVLLHDVLDLCFPMIDKVLMSGGKVFIHCNAGVSRSPSVVIAYILYRSYQRKPWASISFNDKCDEQLSLSEAIELVKNQRECIKPNPGFLEQLRQYECKLRDEETNECVNG